MSGQVLGLGPAVFVNTACNCFQVSSIQTGSARASQRWSLFETHLVRSPLSKTADGKRCRVARPTGVRASSGELLSGKQELLSGLKKAVETKDSEDVKTAMEQLKEAGHANLWNSVPNVARRQVFVRELSTMGFKNPESLAIPSTRNDLAFLVTVVGVTSVLAVLAGQLPGQWGFWGSYLVGGISLGVLAVGSTAPGLLQAGIDVFSRVFPDYQERLLRHEAAHFLTAYVLGVPVVGYSLDIGREHTNLVDFKLQKRLMEGLLSVNELERLAVVAMAGLAAEGTQYEKVTGQSADLLTLQRLINRTKPKLSNNEQQNLTRWAALYAASLLKNKSKSYDALMKAMESKASVEDCILAIEGAQA